MFKFFCMGLLNLFLFVINLILYIIPLYSQYFVFILRMIHIINTLRTGDADLRFYITTVQDG